MREIEDCSTDEQVEQIDNSRPTSLDMLRASLKDLTAEHVEVKQDIKALNTVASISTTLAAAR